LPIACRAIVKGWQIWVRRTVSISCWCGRLAMRQGDRPGAEPQAPRAQAWMTRMAAYVKSLDANHLVTTGTEGFYSTSAARLPINPGQGARPRAAALVHQHARAVERFPGALRAAICCQLERSQRAMLAQPRGMSACALRVFVRPRGWHASHSCP